MNQMYEQGPIRPPSEAESLLIRVTRNCPWNRCEFCHTYQGRKFELRSVEEVKADIRCAKEIADEIRALSWKMGLAGQVGASLVNCIYNDAAYNESWRAVCAWLYFGARSVFLQDANSIILKTEDLAEILRFIRECFPAVNRITSYCRSQTATRKTVEEFKTLREAGLDRIHVGMESGYDPLLKFIRKGVTQAQQIEGGRRIVAAGISLCEYIMPGLGGQAWSREHAEATAFALNEIKPEYVRLRSLQVRRGTGLYEKMKKGEFHPLSDDEVVKEIRLLITRLETQTNLVSDHILNLLQELEGRLPDEKEHLLGIIDRYFRLSDEQRAVYRLGRRQGVYSRLSDLDNPVVFSRLKSLIDDYRSDPGALEQDLDGIKQNFI